MNRQILGAILLAVSAVSYAGESHFNQATKSVQCAEPIPEFTLAHNSNPSNSEVKRLCSCVWSKFPEDGWERNVSAAAAQGKNPGPNLRAFIHRFGEAMKQCGAYSL